jgi:2-oxo-4-hydroxy-4-carboxy-5-ureidoimidazoline decarboxylase
MTLSALNSLNRQQLKEELVKCCGSSSWVEEMASKFPVKNEQMLLDHARDTWFSCSKADWLEAFSHHPLIGDLDSLRRKFASTAEWAAGEQSSVTQASSDIIETLARWNARYQEKFGYIFIICATGKTAKEILAMLATRLSHNKEEEIKTAMVEQFKITEIRLKKLLAQ